MIEILTQRERSAAVRRLRFCYLCGEPLGQKRGVGWEPDHLPPTAYVSNRASALPVRTHPACNREWSQRDERAGQLFSTMIGRYPPSPERTRIDVTRFINAATGEAFVGVLDFGVEPDIRRMVRAFHAVLYDEYLPDERIRISLPFSSGFAPSNVPTPDVVPRWHPAAVVDLLRSKAVERIDRLVSGGSECE